jgi:hypothetical protein
MTYINPYINAPSIIPFSIQTRLADVNDASETFTPVVEVIKEFKDLIVANMERI